MLEHKIEKYTYINLLKNLQNLEIEVFYNKQGIVYFFC